MKKLYFLLPVLVVIFFIITGQKSPDVPQKWAIDHSTGIYDPSVTVSAPLPQADNNYVNPNTETRIIKTPYEELAVTPNVRVLPRTNSWQTEVDIKRHPTNPNIMFGSSNAFNNVGSLFISEGVYVTTNGGLNWFGSDTTTGAPISNHGGDPGITIDKNGTLIQTHLGFATSGMFANYSTDNGLSWSPNYTIQSGSVDKNLAGTDDSPTSPYYGRSYCVYTVFSSPYNATISYTTNSGVSWSSPTTIIPPQPGYIARGEDVRTARNGDVYVTWANNVGSGPEDFCAFAKSTNGGVSFTGSNNVFDMNGLLVFGTGFAPYGIRMNSFVRMDVDKSGGPRDGWIYIVTSQKNLAPAGSDPDIILHRSTDGGTTWSAGIRVNQDPLNNGKQQFYNAIKVDEAGGVNVVYYDNRNTAADSAEVMISRSLDGGTTWTDIVVSDHRFRPKAVTLSGIAGGYAGDYIGITSGNGKLWPIWMDDITGIYQAWTTGVQITTYALNAFNLNSPAPNSRIQSFPNGTTNYTFNWDTSASTASYKWIFGNPTATTRKITLTPTGNTLNITDGQLDVLLAGLGVAPGDSLLGQWNVWAFRNNATNDSLISANGPRAITLKRGTVTLAPFALSSPNTGARIVTSPVDPSLVNINWRKSGSGASYKWLFKVGATYTDPATINIAANNSGYDTVLSIRNSQVDSILAAFGIAPGDSSVGQWRVRAYSTSDSLNSTAPDRTITFRRTGLIPLDQDFVDPSFPPPFWSLANGGGTTQYWSRNAIGGYQTGVGSAKYDYWTAGTATPLQTLTSNQFPPVASPNNYLRFNYAHAYYLAGTTLAPDSCIIETSINNGTTWTRLIGMGASQTLTSGVNSLPGMSTLASQSSFTPILASNWATKVFAMPVGTNKVRFATKSGFGNNLYIDRVTSGILTGIEGNAITLTPDKFELSQNYPNPFNPVTKISFSIPKQSLVSLKVYDMLGKEVAKLVNEVKTAGVYNVNFDASSLSSGVYFYKIEAGNFSEIKKMMLIK